MHRKIQDILKKINYIEADVEIQKQILFSLPSNEKSEMERILACIAAHKKEIDNLRRTIEEISPAEHKNILILESAVTAFKEMASKKKFISVEGKNINEECHLTLKDGSRLDCLVKACDEQGGWTIITSEGAIQHLSREEVDNGPQDPEDSFH